MAANITQIPAPRVPLIDANTNTVSREWFVWFNNLYAIAGNGTGIIAVINGGTGLGTIPTNGQLLIGNGTGYSLNTLFPGAGISVSNGSGSISLANTGVLSNIAGSGISVSSATGNVTVSNTGVLSAIAGTGISVSSPTGNVTFANTGVLSFSSGTTGLTPSTATTGAVTLAGTLISVNGGTGQASYAIGDLLYADTTTTLAKLPDVATGNALISGGISTAPSWGKIGLTTHVSGVLPIANGGTNSSATPTAYGVSYGTGTAYAFTAAGTAKQVLIANTSAAPTWSTLTSGTSILYGDGSGGFSNVTIGTGVSFVAGTLSATGSGGTVTSVSGTAGRITSTGGTTPVIDLASGVATAGTTGSSTLIPVVTIDTYGRVTSITTAANPQGTVTSVTGTSPVVSSGGTTPAISLAAAYGDTLNPYGTKTATYVLAGPTTGAATAPTFRALVSTDIPSLSYVTSVGFTGGLITVATPTTTPALTVAGTSGGIVYFSSASTWASSALLTQYGIVYGGGAGAAPVSTAAGTTGQVLTATTSGAPTWANPATNGTVTSVSVVSANGFAGTVATATTTPAITLTTSITGVIKGNGTAISAAVANTDYIAPSAVVTKTADFTLAATENWVINNKPTTACTVTLPAASSWSGRSVMFTNYQTQTLISASSNVVPLGGGAAGTAILLGVVGNWATMVSDGTNWIIMQAAANNCLLLE